MLMLHHQNAWQNHNRKIANRFLEKVAKLKYLGTTLTNQNLIYEEIKSTLNLGIACYHSIHNLLSSLLSKNVRIKIKLLICM
jgi:hypothetical protein